MSQSLNGAHIALTGGAGALGAAVVAAFTQAGAICHAPSIDELDLRDEHAVAAHYASLPPLWASVHLAGGFAMKPVADLTLADFQAQLDINLITCFVACREAVRAIRKTGQGGRIVNVAARAAVVPTAGMLGYTCAKAGVASLTQCLAEEVKGDGILVNAVLPSMMDTPANRRSMPDANFDNWPKTHEVAAAIRFLASHDNTLSTGVLLPVYGRA